VTDPPYLTYARYLRARFGCSVYRVAVDAGFSCPNRSGGRSDAGCTYCGEDGARAPYLAAASPAEPLCCGNHDSPDPSAYLASQVRDALAFLRRRYDAKAFILYFQAFSNTNAGVETLKQVYDTGLALAAFRGLNVATRPDCLDARKADLLASYRERGLEVWVELGLQSAHDDTLLRVRRGHTLEGFLRAYRLLRERELKIAVHLIFGLPGEDRARIMRTIDTVARLRPEGVKIHNLHIPKGTLLAREYAKGEITAPSSRRHLEHVIAALERLPPQTVIMRLTCDTPLENLMAPRVFLSKQAFNGLLAKEMRARGAWQGRLCTETA